MTIVYELLPLAGPKMHETHYYRSDGSYALSVLIEGDTKAPPTSVVDLATKRNFLKDPATNLFDEFPLTQRDYDSHRHTALSCEATIRSQSSQTCDSIGDDEVLGYRVQKITTIIGGKRPGVSESLLAPALDFVPLVQYDTRDGKMRTVRRAISIKVGEPDESVFALPFNYRKVEDSSEFISAWKLHVDEVSRLPPIPSKSSTRLSGKRKREARTTRFGRKRWTRRPLPDV